MATLGHKVAPNSAFRRDKTPKQVTAALKAPKEREMCLLEKAASQKEPVLRASNNGGRGDPVLRSRWDAAGFGF